MISSMDHGDGLGQAFEASSDEIETLYDDWVGDYDRDVVDWGYEAPAVVADRLASLVAHDAAVLDAGCGTGLTGAALASRGFINIVGIDLSADSLERATSREVYRETQRVDLNGPLPFDDESFDAVICCGVLSYVDDLDGIVGEFLRVVPSDGSVVFTQRTDLWDARDDRATIERLVGAGRCTADVSGPRPYLPGHPEFGTDIEVRYVTLRAT